MRLSCNAERNNVNTSVSVFYYLCSCRGAKFNSVRSYSASVIILQTLQHWWPQLPREGQTKKYVIRASRVLLKEREHPTVWGRSVHPFMSRLVFTSSAVLKLLVSHLSICKEQATPTDENVEELQSKIQTFHSHIYWQTFWREQQQALFSEPVLTDCWARTCFKHNTGVLHPRPPTIKKLVC